VVGAFSVGTVGIGIDLMGCTQERVVLGICKQLLLNHKVAPVIEVVYGCCILKVRFYIDTEAFIEPMSEQGS
jgi:hypothetical protein